MHPSEWDGERMVRFDAWFARVPPSGHCQRRTFMLTLRTRNSCRTLRTHGVALAICRACTTRAAREMA